MKIACLGWGSLIWDPRDLYIQNEWFKDGPHIPVEFLRQSGNGRITLVIDQMVEPVQSLWALMTVSELEAAIESLRAREETLLNNIHHVKRSDNQEDELPKSIQKWMITKNLDAVIWTGLSYKFSCNEKMVRPTIEQIISYLNDPENAGIRPLAEEYIRKAPKQINTKYRREIEKLLQWYPFE